MIWVVRVRWRRGSRRYRSPAVLLSADGTKVSGTVALFTEPAARPWRCKCRTADAAR